MKKINLFFIITCLSFLINSNAAAQVNYDLHAAGGLSNLLHTASKRTGSIYLGNFYTSAGGFSIGSHVHFPIKNSRFNIITGLDYVSLATICHINDEDFEKLINDPWNPYTGRKSWEQRQHNISVPVKISFLAADFLSVNAGLINMIKLNNMYGSLSLIEPKVYTLGVGAGVDFYLLERFVLGVEYYRDLSRTHY